MSLLVTSRHSSIAVSNALKRVKGINGALSVLNVRDMSSNNNNADNILPVSTSMDLDPYHVPYHIHSLLIYIYIYIYISMTDIVEYNLGTIVSNLFPH
jgi:hypothetical protein